jgi:adenylate kinase family enzyme
MKTGTSRFAILGNSGSGKSTLANTLAAQHDVEVLDLDTVAWEPGTVGVPRDAEAAAADVHRFCTAHDGFILEGCYENLIEAAFVYQPRLIYLDPGPEVCERHCRARPFEPHKYESLDAQNGKLEFLLAWVRAHYTRQGPMSQAEHVATFERYDGPKIRYFTEVGVAASGSIEPCPRS